MKAWPNCRRPSKVMETVRASLSRLRPVRLSGSFTSTPVVIIGAAIMKMISSTNITSMSGVMLMSAIAPRLLPGVKAMETSVWKIHSNVRQSLPAEPDRPQRHQCYAEPLARPGTLTEGQGEDHGERHGGIADRGY